MPRLFVGNFDFEHALAGGGAARPERLKLLEAQMALAWLAVAEDGDGIHIPLAGLKWDPDEAVGEGWPRVSVIRTEAELRAWRATRPQAELCPWGWTATERQLAERLQLAAVAPPEVAIRTVNSRRFSFDLEQELTTALPGASAVTTPEALPAAIHRAAIASQALAQAAPHDTAEQPAGEQSAEAPHWLMKAEFGMAGRERFAGREDQLTEQLRRWAARRLSSGAGLFVEPWVSSAGEVGIQWTIPRNGPPVLEGLSVLISDASGTWRGSGFTPDEELRTRWQPAIEITRIAAERIRQTGYFGPVGIDAMQYIDAEGMPRFRPLQDINARFTMGRLSLGLLRHLRPGEQGLWCSLNRRQLTGGEPDDGTQSDSPFRSRLRTCFPEATRIMPAVASSVSNSPPELGFAAVFCPEESRFPHSLLP